MLIRVSFMDAASHSKELLMTMVRIVYPSRTKSRMWSRKPRKPGRKAGGYWSIS